MSKRPTAPAALKRSELPVGAVALAKFLLGKRLVRRVGDHVLTGRITETEAYMPDDPASHTFRGETARNRTMFGPRGHAYVYLIYGMWACFNVSGGEVGVGEGVLVRAVEPLTGIDLMQQRRKRSSLRDLARGPGRLCVAFDIDRTLNDVDLCRPGPLYLASGEPPARIGVSPRIGLAVAAEAPLRFFDGDSLFVSTLPRAPFKPRRRKSAG